MMKVYYYSLCLDRGPVRQAQSTAYKAAIGGITIRNLSFKQISLSRLMTRAKVWVAGYVDYLVIPRRFLVISLCPYKPKIYIIEVFGYPKDTVTRCRGNPYRGVFLSIVNFCYALPQHFATSSHCFIGGRRSGTFPNAISPKASQSRFVDVGLIPQCAVAVLDRLRG